MFLIDMKIISKLLYILLLENLSFSDPHLHRSIFKICTHFSTKTQNETQEHAIENNNKPKQHTRNTQTHTEIITKHYINKH